MSSDDTASYRSPGRERIGASGRRAKAISLLDSWIERARSFSGWNFDDLNIIDLEAAPPWDYVAIAREYAAKADRIIDLGTGGGEVFGRVIAGLPSSIVRPPSSVLASEEWHVNAPVARDRLRSLDVAVVNASSERTPWRDESFDLILSRHEAIIPNEIVRILKPGGIFLTQQVAKEEWQELTAFFPERTAFPDHFVGYRREFEAAGLTVETQHHTWTAAYPTIGEIAYMLLLSPWEVPGFDPIRDVDRLLALEGAHATEQGIVLTLARYLMIASKP